MHIGIYMIPYIETVASDNRVKENILSATVELDSIFIYLSIFIYIYIYSQIVTYHSEHCILLLDNLDFEMYSFVTAIWRRANLLCEP